MQEIQIEINEIKNNIYAGLYSEEEYSAKQVELKQLMTKLKRFSDKYMLITKRKEKKEVSTQKLPRSQRSRYIQYAFVTFKNCETKNIVLSML